MRRREASSTEANQPGGLTYWYNDKSGKIFFFFPINLIENVKPFFVLKNGTVFYALVVAIFYRSIKRH